MPLGAILRNARLNAGLTQFDLAVSLDVTVSTVSKYEHDRINTRDKNALLDRWVRAIADATDAKLPRY